MQNVQLSSMCAVLFHVVVFVVANVNVGGSCTLLLCVDVVRCLLHFRD